MRQVFFIINKQLNMIQSDSDGQRDYLDELHQEYDEFDFDDYDYQAPDQDEDYGEYQEEELYPQVVKQKKTSPYTPQESQRAIHYRKQSNLFQTAVKRVTKTTKQKLKADIKTLARPFPFSQYNMPNRPFPLINDFKSLRTDNSQKPMWMKMSENRDKAIQKKEEEEMKKYLDDAEEITEELVKEKNIYEEVRRLKKILHLSINNICDVKLFFGRTYPIIFFSYQRNNKLKYKLLREFIHDNKEIVKANPEFLQNIFQKLYSKVSPQYYLIFEIVLQNGKRSQINMKRWQLQRKNKPKEDILFFYGINQQELIQFILFSQHLKYLRMSSNDVEKIRRSNGNQYKIAFQKYDQFKEVALKTHKIQHKYNLFENQQISFTDQSSQVESQEEEIDLSEKRQALNRLLKKDISDYENKQMERETSSNMSQSRNKLNESQKMHLNKIHLRVEAFKRERISVEKQLQNFTEPPEYFVSICLKKLQLLENQLESQLPIINYKQQIFNHLDHSQILLLEGETGCGKSTQIPLILCQYFSLLDNQKSHPIMITEPRKIAVRNIAQRVAFQLSQKIGELVDYRASNDNKKINIKTKIVFKLDRLLLDQLIDDPLLSKYSCLVIDQAHERTVSIDIILGFITSILKKRKDFKVVIASASMDIGLFQKYFKTKSLKILGRQHEVELYYMPSNEASYIQKIIKVFNTQLLKDNNSLLQKYRGHILVFCNQVDEIMELCIYFKERLNKNIFKILPLHSKISPQQQRQIFLPSREYKIIFCTNIAETAITINDIKVVIDPGLTKSKVFDHQHKIHLTKIEEISQSSAKQRSGRAGRTTSGSCFRLYNYQNFCQRNSHNTPEIQNESLDLFTLRLISLNIENINTFPFLTKPRRGQIQSSIQTLKIIGAINENCKIKAIGKLLVKISMEPMISRSIVESLFFSEILKNNVKIKDISAHWKEKDQYNLSTINISSQISIILSMLTYYDDLFKVSPNEHERLIMKQRPIVCEDGDFIYLLKLYKQYRYFKGNSQKCQKWSKKYLLNLKTFKLVDQLYDQIEKLSKSSKIRFNKLNQELQRAQRKLKLCKNVNEVILSCLMSSFSTNLCLYSGNPKVGYTLISTRKPIHICPNSSLSSLGFYPQWIVTHDFYSNEKGYFFCKIANQTDYEFVINTVEPYILDKFNLPLLNKVNPFYQRIEFHLPTAIINQIKQDFSVKQYRKNLQFMRNIEIVVNQPLNSIQFFILIEKNQQYYDENDEKTIETRGQSQVKIYLNHLITEMKKPYKHHYFGSIYVDIEDGFVIKQILLNRNEIVIEVKQIINENIHELLLQALHDSVDYYQKLESNNKRIFITLQKEQDRIFVKNMLNRLLEMVPNVFKYEETIGDARKKLALRKVFLYFFAGEPNSDLLYLGYKDKQIAKDMLPNLQLAVLKKKVKDRNFILDDTCFKLSKAETGINYADQQIDEYDFIKAVGVLQEEKLFQFAFKMPDIKRFRDPNQNSTKTNEEWEEEIVQLLKQNLIDPSLCTINVSGTPIDKNSKTGERIQMKASIISFDQSIGAKLKWLDGFSLFGCTKVHVYQKYQQVLAYCNKSVFNKMYEEIYRVITQFKSKNVTLEFQIKQKRIKNLEKVMIICRSSSKQALLKPLKIISSMLKPKIIQLSEIEYDYFENAEEGKSYLKCVEEDENFNVLFRLNSSNHLLQVYCRKNQFKKFAIKINVQKMKINRFVLIINYSGKNLRKIIQLLQKLKSNTDGWINYHVKYNSKQIIISSSTDQNFQEISYQINQLRIQDDNRNCKICCALMILPYRLEKCKHQFCHQCLIKHIKQYNVLSEFYPCPECSQAINIFDLKEIIDEEEFNRICDIRTKDYASKRSSEYILCRNCDKIYDAIELKNGTELTCEICEYVFCLKCFESHQGISCSEWAHQNQFEQYIQKMNAQKCPSCKITITKQKGCNHMKCKNCNSHFCWTCQIGLDQNKIIAHFLQIHQGNFFGI